MEKRLGIKYGLLFAALCLCVLLLASNQSGLTPEELFDQQAGAVFKILTTRADGTDSRASGFFISGCGIAVTNHHVMEDVVRASVLTHCLRRFEVLGYYSYDYDNDIAIIQVGNEVIIDSDDDAEEQTPSGERVSSFQYVTLSSPDGVQTGQEVFVISSPGGRLNTFHQTYVSRLGSVAERPARGTDLYDVWEVAAQIRVGSSGGAVFNGRGQVVGVIFGTSTRSGMGYFMPIDRLDRTGIVPGEYLPLPLWGAAKWPDEGYELFPLVPVFGLASPNAQPIGSTAVPDDAPIYFRYTEYLFMYDLPSGYIWEGVLDYSNLLGQHDFPHMGTFGDFVVTEYIQEGLGVFVFYSIRWDISVILIVDFDGELFVITIGSGNAYEPIHEWWIS